MSKISKSGQAVTDTEESDLSRAAGEYMFSGLRLVEGICLDTFFTRFGKSPAELYPQISEWVYEGLMATDGNRLRLTPRGILVANNIFVDFV